MTAHQSQRLALSMRTRWAAIGAAVAVAIGGTAIGIADAAVTSGERAIFVAITPCRLFDTRAADVVGPRATPLQPGETYQQAVTGTNGHCTLPADAIAVALNVTVVNGTAPSYLTLWPSDAERPLASSLNWTAGAPPIPNKVDIDLGADGSMKLFNNAGTVDVLADVVGYYADHNHDDRYYTKLQFDERYYTKMDADSRYYTKAQADARFGGIQRVVYGAGAATGYFGGSLDVRNGCVISSGGAVLIPIPLPVGATLRSVDITILDNASDTTGYVAQVAREDIGGVGRATSGGALAFGGTIPRVADRNVVEHLALPLMSVVSETVTYEALITGLSSATGNGFCGLTVEYERAP